MACYDCDLLRLDLEHAQRARSTAEDHVRRLLAASNEREAAMERMTRERESSMERMTRMAHCHTAAVERMAQGHAAAMERMAHCHTAAMERMTAAHRAEVVGRIEELKDDTRRLFAPFKSIQATRKRLGGTNFTGLASDDQQYIILAEDAGDVNDAVSFKLRYGQRKHVSIYQNQRRLCPPSMTGSGASMRAFVTRELRQDYRDDPAIVRICSDYSLLFKSDSKAVCV